MVNMFSCTRDAFLSGIMFYEISFGGSRFFPVWYCSSMASQCPQSRSHKEDFSPLTKSYKSSCLVHLFSTLGKFEPTTSSFKRKEKRRIHLRPFNPSSRSWKWKKSSSPVFVDLVTGVPFVKHHGVPSHISRRTHDLHLLHLDPARGSRCVWDLKQLKKADFLNCIHRFVKNKESLLDSPDA